MKWCLVAAGVNDLRRPADKLSLSQNAGTPYTRYPQRARLMTTLQLSLQSL
jgi:hypothetical protein